MLCVVTMTNVDFILDKVKEINLLGTNREDKKEKEIAEMQQK